MEKLVIGLLVCVLGCALVLVSATAGAFDYSPLHPEEPMANVFGLVVGLFALAVAVAGRRQVPELQVSRNTYKDQEDFGGGGASGQW